MASWKWVQNSVVTGGSPRRSFQREQTRHEHLQRREMSQEGRVKQRTVGKAAGLSVLVRAGLARQGAPGNRRTEWVAWLGGDPPGQLQVAQGSGGSPAGVVLHEGLGNCPVEQGRKGSLKERSG